LRSPADSVGEVTPDLLRLARRLSVPGVLLAVVFTVVGRLLDTWPGAYWPTAHGSWRTLAHWTEDLGAASVAAPPAALLVAGMRVGYHRWREAVFLVTSMVLVTVAITVADAVVSGRTFPATATALGAATYGSVSVVLGRRLSTPLRRTFGQVLPLLGALAVAAGQLVLGAYTAPAVGVSLLGGLGSVVLARRYVLSGGGFEQRARIVDVPLTERHRAAVIINPTKVANLAEEKRAVTRYLQVAGWAEPIWLPTRLDDIGVGLARQAVAEGASVVFACGGDGTICAVLTGLAGTGVPMAILPAGTGNLLARNLSLPQDRDACLRIGLHGTDRKLDVGRVDDTHRFVVMAGMGLDAAMIADAPPRLKASVGWPAYMVSGARHIFDRWANITVAVDDEPPVELRARGVVIGNVGRLQGGMLLLPGAVPDDGILDVAVLVPATFRQWTMLAMHVIRRRPDAPGARIEHFRGRRIRIASDRTWPRQIDGDLLEPGREMTVVVEPSALVVRTP
jgi:diacylglycerol kinase family enzyme